MNGYYYFDFYISSMTQFQPDFREKKDIVDSLRDPEHDYISFFVCRNPVAKLVCQDINILGAAFIIEIL